MFSVVRDEERERIDSREWKGRGVEGREGRISEKE